MTRFWNASLLILATVFLLLSPGSLLAKEDGQWIQAAYHKSYFYERMEKFADAIKVLMPVLKGFPSTYTVNLRMGWLYYRLGGFGNSLRHYEKAIQALPDSLEAKLGLQLPLLAQERYAEAEKISYQILRIDYYNYYANLRLVIALRRQRRADVALKAVETMLGRYPNDVLFLTEMGLLYAQLERRDEMTRVFQSVVLLDPENISAREHLGLVPSGP